MNKYYSHRNNMTIFIGVTSNAVKTSKNNETKNDALIFHPLTQSHRVNKTPEETIHRVNKSQPVNKKQNK